MTPQDVQELRSQIERDRSVKSSAITLINGFQAHLNAAVAAAVAANDNADLSAITEFQTSLRSQTDALASAVEAGTPAAPGGNAPGDVETPG